MADTQTASRDTLPGGDVTGPSIRRRRPLPGGRAVVGAFLVVLATVGVFGAYLQATAAPGTSYLAAGADLDVGRVLTEADVATLVPVPVDLPDEQASRTVRASQRDALVGTVVVAPVVAGDLLLVSAVQPVGSAEEGVQLSFSLPVDRAIGGSVAVGERVDVVATFDSGGSGGGTQTRLVARDVAVVRAPGASEGLDGGRVLLTVQVPDLVTAQAIQFAVDEGRVALLRGSGGRASAPPTDDGLVGEPDATVDGGTGLGVDEVEGDEDVAPDGDADAQAADGATEGTDGGEAPTAPTSPAAPAPASPRADDAGGGGDR